MPYNPAGAFDIKDSALAGRALIDPLSEALDKYKKEKAKTQFNRGMFELLKDQKDTSGNPIIPVEAIARWDSMNPDKQAGVLAAAGAALKHDLDQATFKRQQDLVTSQIAENTAHADYWKTGGSRKDPFQVSKEDEAAMNAAGFIKAPNSQGSVSWVKKPNAPSEDAGEESPIIDPRDKTGQKIMGIRVKKKNGEVSMHFFGEEDPKEALIRDLIRRSGGGAAPAPAPEPTAAPTATPRPSPPTLPELTPSPIPTTGGDERMMVVPPVMPTMGPRVGPTVPPPPGAGAGAARAAATPGGPAMGGYVAGHLYGGQVYLGGDPKNPANWRRP